MKSAKAVQNAASNEKPASLNTIPEIKVPESAGLSSHVDIDDNLRIAETFTKELDNICSKLKMKREESKELQVRSIINNNALLLLNYPMLEENIQKLQVFASSLLLKEI
ncbi:Uncharacterized protein AXF42_Ash017142 [Apostasia shenzhenica]|uniref:Uncharacterized protein n=1 Tax=Apostasia shenzhenica TaxID=1088818 RepID=A0A2H9ZV88_9ASPA|nr:Uncharacterized protein AXF42_Ash017142 [Apostasia shenzhenica]